MRIVTPVRMLRRLLCFCSGLRRGRRLCWRVNSGPARFRRHLLRLCHARALNIWHVTRRQTCGSRALHWHWTFYSMTASVTGALRRGGDRRLRPRCGRGGWRGGVATCARRLSYHPAVLSLQREIARCAQKSCFYLDLIATGLDFVHKNLQSEIWGEWGEIVKLQPKVGSVALKGASL